MGFNIVLTGMVLSAIPVGEYDKRITILTRERGKITAFAKGARRSGNQLLAAANPFAFGQFEVYQGKSTYTAVRADIKNYFRELAEDFDMVCYGYYFLEMAEYYAQENADEVERLRLLYQTLRALESRKFSFALIRGIYELKTWTINGEYPNVFECLSCGSKEHLDFFSMRLCLCVLPGQDRWQSDRRIDPLYHAVYHFHFCGKIIHLPSDTGGGGRVSEFTAILPESLCGT